MSARDKLAKCAYCGGPPEYVMGSVRCRKCGMRGPVGSHRHEQALRWDELQALVAAGKEALKPKPGRKAAPKKKASKQKAARRGPSSTEATS